MMKNKAKEQMMKWEINFIVTYEVEASSKWEAVGIAEQIFNADTHFDYGVDVNPLGYDDEEEEEEEEEEDD